MENPDSHLKDHVPCAHCSASGTCASGPNGASCLVCLREHKIKDKSAVGIACGVCMGYGIAEPKTARLKNRLVPILSLLIVYLALAMVMILSSKEHFTEVLAFAATLIGSVTGYYFGGKNKT